MSKTCSYVTPITAGTYTNANVTVDQQGVVTGIANGTGTTPLPVCILSKNVTATYASGSIIPWEVVLSDTNSMFSGSTFVTIPSSGIYILSFNMFNQGGIITIAVQQNSNNVGTTVGTQVGDYYQVSVILPLTVGDFITVRIFGSNSLTVVPTPGLYNFAVARIK